MKFFKTIFKSFFDSQIPNWSLISSSSLDFLRIVLKLSTWVVGSIRKLGQSALWLGYSYLVFRIKIKFDNVSTWLTKYNTY